MSARQEQAKTTELSSAPVRGDGPVEAILKEIRSTDTTTAGRDALLADLIEGSKTRPFG